MKVRFGLPLACIDVQCALLCILDVVQHIKFVAHNTCLPV